MKFEKIDIKTYKEYLKKNNISNNILVFMENDGSWFIQKELLKNPQELCLNENDFKLFYDNNENTLICCYFGGKAIILDKRFENLKLMYDKKWLMEAII